MNPAKAAAVAVLFAAIAAAADRVRREANPPDAAPEDMW